MNERKKERQKERIEENKYKKMKKTRNNEGKKNKSEYPTERTSTLKDKNKDINANVQRY